MKVHVRTQTHAVVIKVPFQLATAYMAVKSMHQGGRSRY